MPDFMSGLAEGISSNEETVLDKVRGLAEGISSLTKAATADVATATASTATPEERQKCRRTYQRR